MKKLKAHFYRWQGNRQLKCLKSELGNNSSIRESLLTDFEKLDQAIADLHARYSVAEGEEARELARQISEYECIRREMKIKFNQIIVKMDGLREEAVVLEGQFRAMEAIFDGEKSSNLS